MNSINSNLSLATKTPKALGRNIATYNGLLEFGKKRLHAAGRSPQQIANFASALNGWICSNHRGRDDVIGADFEAEFDARFLRYQDERREEIGQRTLKDRCEQILWWRNIYEAFSEGDTLPVTFSDALRFAFERSKLTKAGLCRLIGCSQPTLDRWLKGDHMPELASEPLIRAAESALGLPDGTLVRRLPLRRRTRYARNQSVPVGKTMTKYGARGQRNRRLVGCYALAPTPRLKEQWQRLLRLKTDTNRPYATSRNSWRMKIPGQTGIRVVWSMLLDGRVCATAGVHFNQFAMFLGFLCLDKKHGGLGLPKDSIDTLAWLTKPEYVEAHIAWQQRRADGILHNGLFAFLDVVRSYLRPKTGFLWLNSDLASTLPAEVHVDLQQPETSQEEIWQARCAGAHKRLLEFKGRLGAKGKPERSRDPRESIQALLASPFPLKELVEMIYAIENDPPPSAHQRDYVVWIRDVLLLKLLTNHPLRASHFSIMTFRGSDANLFRVPGGDWHLHFSPETFKNQKGAAHKPYDVEIHPSVSLWLNRYLAEARPFLVGADDCDYLLLPSVVGKRRGNSLAIAEGYERTLLWFADCISKRVKYVTSRYYSCGAGFGTHSFRHIVATDHLKRNPRDYFTVAQMLHDKLETVIKAYSHLEVADGARTIRTSIELAEQLLAAERGLPAALA